MEDPLLERRLVPGYTYQIMIARHPNDDSSSPQLVYEGHIQDVDSENKSYGEFVYEFWTRNNQNVWEEGRLKRWSRKRGFWLLLLECLKKAAEK